MAVMQIPPMDTEPWPSLGPAVAKWITDNLVFGPGDLRGEPAKLDDEKYALLHRLYEVYPEGHPNAGRRRFRRAAICLRKGTAKTEFAAWIAAAELHPDAPVRCRGWQGGKPLGRGVVDPYIPMVAYTEEQVEDLAYHALRVILEHSKVRADFDIGLERIMRRGGDGKCVALAAAPDARDGARTTFQHFDESHRFTLPRLVAAHRTMLANLPKRRGSDAWSLETTTAHVPGEGSVAELTAAYAAHVAEGRVNDTEASRLLYYRRWAAGDHDLATKPGREAAVREASGPVAAWSDIDGIVEQWDDPTADTSYLERVWLNREVRSSEQAFDLTAWAACLDREAVTPPAGSLIVLGFDGSLTRDDTALVATHVPTGYQWLAGHWSRPAHVEDWQVPVTEVNAVMDGLFATYDVWRLYADPYKWRNEIAHWRGKYGEKAVVDFWTSSTLKMVAAIQSYRAAIAGAMVRHNGDPVMAAQLGNAHRKDERRLDDQGRPMWILKKERPDSPKKIDVAMAAILSWEARSLAIAAGAIEVGKLDISRLVLA